MDVRLLGVSMIDGTTAFAVTPVPRVSSAMVCARMMTPALATA